MGYKQDHSEQLMAKANLIMKVKIRWWFKYLYLPAWISLAKIYNEFMPIDEQPEPNENFKWWLKKGVSITTVSS